MLSLREYRDRLQVSHGYQLSRKPREIDCVIIDLLYHLDRMDNDIARIFARHNVIELKNPFERLTLETIWKVISYAAQYLSDNAVSADEITITLLRSSRPNKALKQLKTAGYTVDNAYPGMVDPKLQIVVTRELEGDTYVPLRMQMKNADRSDYRKFANNIVSEYTSEESGYVESVVKYGTYDDMEDIYTVAKEDKAMYDKLMELFEDDIKKREAAAEARGEVRGEAKGEIERKRLEKENESLRKQLAKYRTVAV